VDNSKWAKFTREMKLLPTKDASQVDLAFAKNIAGVKERKLNLKGFVACCTDIAVIRWPSMKDRPKEALTKLLLENVVMLPPVNRLAWKEAKRLAIVMEATRICAAVRMESFHRRNVSRLYFNRKRIACVRTQTQIRRIISKSNLNRLNSMIEDTRIFRIRHRSAVFAQKTFRMHFSRKAFLRHKKEVKDEEMRLVREYRKKLNDARKTREASVVFKTVRVIQGLFTLIEMSRKDNRRQSTDYGINVRVYLPSSQEMFKFSIEEDMMRELLEQAMEVDALSVQEMMLPSSLVHLTDRFTVRETNGRPIILFSRRSSTERGLLVNKSSERIRYARMYLRTKPSPLSLTPVLSSGQLFIVFVYRSPDDFVFRAYVQLRPVAACEARSEGRATRARRNCVLLRQKQAHSLGVWRWHERYERKQGVSLYGGRGLSSERREREEIVFFCGGRRRLAQPRNPVPLRRFARGSTPRPQNLRTRPQSSIGMATHSMFCAFCAQVRPEELRPAPLRPAQQSHEGLAHRGPLPADSEGGKGVQEEAARGAEDKAGRELGRAREADRFDQGERVPQGAPGEGGREGAGAAREGGGAEGAAGGAG
jgi:hypothetical protein